MQAVAGWFDFKFTRRRIFTFAGIALALAALAVLYREIDMPALHRRAEDINGAVIFVLMTVVPMVGFPVSITHAVAGVRFGFGLGLALVAVSTVLQLVASYALVKAMPDFFARHLEPLRQRLPKAAHRPLTQFTMLLPGVPYFAQNYVIPLVGVPLGIYLRWSIPIHVSKAAIGVVFGDMSDDLTPVRIAGFAVYAVAITVACTWAFRRLQARMKDPPPKASGRKRRDSGHSAGRTRSAPRSGGK